jgi:hypothetical protein
MCYIYEEPLLDTSKKKIICIFSHQNMGQNCNIKINPLIQFRHLGIAVTNQNCICKEIKIRLKFCVLICYLKT